MCSFNRGNIEGINSLKICVWYLCMYASFFCLCRDWSCGLTAERVFLWEEFWNVHLLMLEFDCPEVTLCGWQNIQIQLLTTFGVTTKALREFLPQWGCGGRINLNSVSFRAFELWIPKANKMLICWCVCVCLHACACLCVGVCMHQCMCVSVRMHVCVCASVCVCVFVWDLCCDWETYGLACTVGKMTRDTAGITDNLYVWNP